jgi:hypothetical protein
MCRLVLVLAVLSAFCLLFPGCAKLPEQTAPSQEPTLALLSEALVDSIPMEYGELIAVTTNETHPRWAQLWFKRDDGSVVVVYVNYTNRYMGKRALVIPRS